MLLGCLLLLILIYKNGGTKVTSLDLPPASTALAFNNSSSEFFTERL